jgi:hypothetical protein
MKPASHDTVAHWRHEAERNRPAADALIAIGGGTVLMAYLRIAEPAEQETSASVSSLMSRLNYAGSSTTRTPRTRAAPCGRAWGQCGGAVSAHPAERLATRRGAHAVRYETRAFCVTTRLWIW